MSNQLYAFVKKAMSHVGHTVSEGADWSAEDAIQFRDFAHHTLGVDQTVAHYLIQEEERLVGLIQSHFDVTEAPAPAEQVLNPEQSVDPELAAQAEQERLVQEQAEQQRLDQEQEQMRLVAEQQAEQERVAAEIAEQTRLAQEQEQQRLAQEQAEQERLTQEQNQNSSSENEA